ncbi:MAG: hypothetical protein JRE71_16755 [Deltaproteobacteria bacterium]|nr:hypothetical protein [Deltaproteobacteria bacterium]
MAAANSMQVFEPSQEADPLVPDDLPESLTLLELVYAISGVTSNDQLVVDTVVSMLTNGRVQLRGNFRNDPIEDFEV